MYDGIGRPAVQRAEHMLGDFTPAMRSARKPVDRLLAIDRYVGAVKTRAMEIHEAKDFLRSRVAAFGGNTKFAYGLSIP